MDWTLGPTVAVSVPSALTRKLERDVGARAIDSAPPGVGWSASGSLGISSKVKVSMLEVRGNCVYDMLRRGHGYVAE